MERRSTSGDAAGGRGSDAKRRSSAARKSSLALKGEKNVRFLNCPLCAKVYRYPVETGCGHVFCARCLQKNFRRSKVCPTCDRPIEYVHPCFVLRELIVKYGNKRGAGMIQAEFAPYEDENEIPDLEDPIIIASQFVDSDPGGTCSCNTGGIFDPSDLYFSEHLDEFVSVEEFLDTIKSINQIIASSTPGRAATCMGRYCCFCWLYAHTRNLVGAIQDALADCNVRCLETGLWWTLMHLDRDIYSVGNLDNKMYLILRIDPAKARNYQSSVIGGMKEGELARLRRENVLLRHKMLEIGQASYLRGITAKRKELLPRGRFPHSFYAEYPDCYVVAPRTLRQLVLFKPGRSTRQYFLPPWARVRSMSSGLLPMNREEESALNKVGTVSMTRRSDATSPSRRSDSQDSVRSGS